MQEKKLQELGLQLAELNTQGKRLSCLKCCKFLEYVQYFYYKGW